MKPLQCEIFDVSYLFLYLAENLQCLFNIVYKVVYKSELVNQNINFYIRLQVHEADKLVDQAHKPETLPRREGIPKAIPESVSQHQR